MTEHVPAPQANPGLGGDTVDVLLAVWQEALGLDDVDPDAGFFDLGATSAVMLDVTRILRRRWPRVRIVDVFSHPTVRQLAIRLDEE